MTHSDVNFYHMGIAPKLLSILDRMKFITPTPIQHKTIPMALEGKDIVGIAQTGTGKTLAFGIPVVQHVASNGTRALILTPTRELAMQVNEVLKPLLKEFNQKSVVLIGGMPIYRQIKDLRKKPNVIIATPGRLIDHMEQKNLKLGNLDMLVLDEADRMFDMGFAPQVQKIMKRIPHKRQTLLFSATMPEHIIGLVTKYMKLPTQVEIAASKTSSNSIEQELFIVKEPAKAKLLSFLIKKHKGSSLIFTRTKSGARKLNKKLMGEGHRAAQIHSDRTMAQRKAAIEGFKSGRHRILVATDIAARGIHVDMIEVVINYDLPEDVENYVHRIGRTGRAGKEGRAISFARPDQASEISRIERFTKKSIRISKHHEFTSAEFDKKESRSFKRNKRRRGRPFDFKKRKGKNKNFKKRKKRVD